MIHRAAHLHDQQEELEARAKIAAAQVVVEIDPPTPISSLTSSVPASTTSVDRDLDWEDHQ